MSSIDYGRGEANIDKATGIRFGCISQHSVSQAWCDSSEGDYGPASCPECGSEACDYSSLTEEEQEEFEPINPHSCNDYACKACKAIIGSDEAFGEEPSGWIVDDGEFQACSCLDSDILITRSPFFTRGPFCSPCVPGAIDLDNADGEGERAYCFDADWFDADCEPCRYPIWRVSDGKQVYTPPEPLDFINSDGSIDSEGISEAIYSGELLAIGDDWSKVPEGYTGSIYYVSDHGNPSLYYRDSEGNDREIWSRV